MDTEWGEEGESEMHGESNMEIYITISEMDEWWEFALWLMELRQGLCDNLEEWVEKEDGREFWRERAWVYLWMILVDVWQKTTEFSKAIILQLKKNLRYNFLTLQNHRKEVERSWKL